MIISISTREETSPESISSISKYLLSEKFHKGRNDLQELFFYDSRYIIFLSDRGLKFQDLEHGRETSIEIGFLELFVNCVLRFSLSPEKISYDLRGLKTSPESFKLMQTLEILKGDKREFAYSIQSNF